MPSIPHRLSTWHGQNWPKVCVVYSRDLLVLEQHYSPFFLLLVYIDLKDYTNVRLFLWSCLWIKSQEKNESNLKIKHRLYWPWIHAQCLLTANVICIVCHLLQKHISPSSQILSAQVSWKKMLLAENQRYVRERENKFVVMGYLSIFYF